MRHTPAAGGLIVGVKMMDRDHEEISGMVLELNLQATVDKPWEQSGALLRDLMRATASHFSLEEGMMKTARYPQAAIHRLRHEWMIDQMRVLLARSRESGLAANGLLVELLSESHFAHMHAEDQGFGLWLNTTPDPVRIAEGTQLSHPQRHGRKGEGLTDMRRPPSRAEGTVAQSL